MSENHIATHLVKLIFVISENSPVVKPTAGSTSRSENNSPGGSNKEKLYKALVTNKVRIDLQSGCHTYMCVSFMVSESLISKLFCLLKAQSL